MALAKWQKEKLEKVKERLTMGPAFFSDLCQPIATQKLIEESARQRYKIWVNHWIISEIEAILKDSDLPTIDRHPI